MKRNAKLLALVLSVLMVLTMVGCSSTTDTGSTSTGTSSGSTSSGSTSTGSTGTSTGSTSTETAAPAELSYWRALDTSKETVVYTNWADSECYKWVAEATNCNVTFIHPPAGQEQEKFNLMIASNEMTDIIERDFSNTGYYPGGADKAIADGVIIALNDAFDKGWVPNLKAYLDAEPELYKQYTTDAGNYIAFPFVREDPLLWTSWGPQARIDWIEEMDIGFSIDNLPDTIADWDLVLRTMKSEGYAEYPLLIVSLGSWGDSSALPGAYGVGWEFYADESNTIQFGPAQDAFRDYLLQMYTWNKDGLVDPDWTAGVNTEQLRSKIMGNLVGVYFSNLGGGMGTWYDTLNATAGAVTAPDHPEGFRSYALPFPTLEEGKDSRFGGSALKITSMNAFISTNCEDVEAACRYLDFGFSEEGKVVFNYGKEGVSFNYVNYEEMNSPVDLSSFGDNFPKWDDHVHDPDDEFALSAILSKYIRAHSSGPFIQDEGYLVQFMQYSDQLATIDVWVGSSDFTGSLLPRMYFTDEESSELATKQNDLLTYKNEQITKFITGDLEINDANWQSFQDGLKQMGLEDVLAIRRASHERAKNR